MERSASRGGRSCYRPARTAGAHPTARRHPQTWRGRRAAGIRYLTGNQSRIRPTGSAEYSQRLAGDFQFKIGADAAAAQNRYTLGLDRPFGGVGLFGVNLVGIRGRDGAPDDNQVKLTWSHTFDSKRGTSGSGNNAAPAWGSLLDQVAKRPTFIPAQVVAKLDTTAIPTRLIAVNKAALPAGSSVNTATGAITTPLGVAATGIAAVTLNAAPFGNSGQFSLSGNNLVTDPGNIVQPAVGVTDTYVVTVNTLGGGTTLVTILVSHGSVKIDSINITNSATDVTASTTTAGPSVSGTTDTGTTLSATVNENGTGYYLVQAAAAAAPTVAAVQGGTTFAMTAGVAASPAISGLTASTAYTVYFVAKDAANNVQAAVQSVSVTTTAAADVTAPTTTAGPSVSGTTDTGTTLSATINENGTGYYLVQAAAAAAPTVAAVQGGTAFAMTAGVAASPAISGLTASTAYTVYFVAKDAANNVQAAVQSVAVTTSAAAVAPTASAVNVSGTVQVGQTLTGSYTYADVNSDAQGASTLHWLRGGVAIAGATASTYTLVIADVGSAITFEVTPVATVAPTTGTPVMSAATAAVTLPAGYVSQGGLTWMKNNVINANGYDTWTNADAYCSGTTILGQTSWRLPTIAELSALYTSGAMNGQGWTLNSTWSSTPHGGGIHEFVYLNNGGVNWGFDTDIGYVTCVR